MEDLDQLCDRDDSPHNDTPPLDEIHSTYNFSLPSVPDDFEIIDNPPPATPEHPGHSTGPRRPEGKARSSRNSVTHGCRSTILLIPGERQEHFDILYDRWMCAYDSPIRSRAASARLFLLISPLEGIETCKHGRTERVAKHRAG